MRPTRTLRWLLATSLATGAIGFGATACNDNSHPSSPTTPTAARVVLSQASVSVITGKKLTLTAQPQASDGTVLSRTVTWASDNVAVATVTSTGPTTAEVTGVSIGTANITASVDGQSASAIVTVTPLGIFIGSAGGTVVSADSNFTIVIPEGALDTLTNIVVSKVDVTALARLAAKAAANAPPPTLTARALSAVRSVTSAVTTAVASATRTGPAPMAATEPVYIPGTGYNVEPAGLTLKKPATVTIRYNQSSVPSGFDQQRLRIRQRDRTQDQWQDCEHLKVQNNAVQATVQHFSVFAIYGTPTEVPVAASVNVAPATLDLETGDVVQLSATVLDSTGATLTTVPVTWAVEDTAVASVSTTGLLTAKTDGTTSVTATAGGKQGSSGVKINRKVGSVHVTLPTTEVVEGTSAQLVADVRDPSGAAIPNASVKWTSLTPTVATVDSTGKVTGVTAGDATIVATSRTKSDTVTVSVGAAVASITISGTTSKPLAAGSTLQLTATAYNSSGQVVTAKIKWTTSSAAIATVSATGLVTGVASGTATITASAINATASVSVRVTGGETTTTGNNLSWPVVFAEGVGLTGSPVATDPGVRPLSTETGAYTELTATAATNPTAAFFYTGNVVDAASGYYLQGTSSTWRAQVVDGTGKSPYDASIYWGDNVASATGNLGAGHPIRVEVALSTTDGVTLLGYKMPYVVNASTPEEVQGTDGTTLAQVPLIYSGGATLTIEQLDGPGGKVIAQVSSAPYAAEINVAGRIIYGAQFKPTVAGTYRLRFILGSGSNVNITAIGNTAGKITIVSPKESAIEVQVTA